ncbi:hypothetical protein C7437_1011045 [Psychrobacillus insolitus]|uniref:Uncharacterized protein n=1 Tax=Psychrobacillus insolitus TaxID=1461 RepID=A0A2W7N7B0_9BACI|nr:DUF6011 domain-containing protein [Psychrobacillus insolitus]PZX07923.1 hypothetical protein C7437_1011045 [Psychrobacillus insolitus]
MSICKRCNRPLKTQMSIDTGYGPICKKKHDEAEEEFLKRQITIDDEIAYREKMKA